MKKEKIVKMVEQNLGLSDEKKYEISIYLEQKSQKKKIYNKNDVTKNDIITKIENILGNYNFKNLVIPIRKDVTYRTIRKDIKYKSEEETTIIIGYFDIANYNDFDELFILKVKEE